MEGALAETGNERAQPLVLGRYVLCDEIGGGGMATVHVGRILGAAGFSRVVAIKRLHPGSAADPEFSTMLVDEARLVSRIRHPNVVPTLDVVALGRELLLVMEYVHGLPIAQLVRIAAARDERFPFAIVVRIMLDVLAGLEAAHEATSERGRPLRIVHRDISPQNVLVGTDGVARIVDFGIAKAEGKLTMTHAGQIKGKLGYMAPEQLRAEEIDRRADLYSVGVMLWELIAGRPLFQRRVDDVLGAIKSVMTEPVPPPSIHAPAISSELDALVLQALDPDPDRRFSSAAAMAAALESTAKAAGPKEVAAFVSELGRDVLGRRTEVVANIEQTSAFNDLPASDGSRPQRPGIEFAASEPTGSLELHRGVPFHEEHEVTPILYPQAPLSTPSSFSPFGPTHPPSPSPIATPRVPDEEVAALDSPPRTPRRLMAVFVLVLVLLAGTIALAFAVAHPDTPVPPRGVGVASAAVPSAGEPPPVPVPAGGDPDGVSNPSTSAQAASSTAPAPSSSVRHKHKAPPDCNPPYRIDARGIRIPKRECLGR
jgi:serine/threonine protein kinase